MASLTIGQVARRAGVRVDTLRFYERRGLIAAPARRASGYREYSVASLGRLRFIRRAKALGFSLAEIRELLELEVSSAVGCGEAARAAREKISAIAAKIEDLEAMRRVLDRFAAACGRRRPAAACPLLEALFAADDAEAT